MTWAATAAIVGSTLISGMAAGDAASAQLGATQAGIGEQRRQFDVNQANMKPWLTTGMAANSRLADLLGISTSQSRGGAWAPSRDQFTKTAPGTYANAPINAAAGQQPQGSQVFTPGSTTFDQAGYDAAVANYNGQSTQNPDGFGSLMTTWTPNDVVNDPGYQFQQGQGEQAVNRAALARGNYFAPSTVQDLLNFNTGLNRSYNADSFNRDSAQKTQKFNMLSGVSGTGQMASNQLGVSGSNTANSISNLMTQGGNAQAAGYVGQANAVNNGVGQGMNWYNQGRIMDWLKPSGSTAQTSANPSWT